MNIVHINNRDLMGRRFNGHDLHLSLNTKGYTSYQIVLEKSSNDPTTKLLSETELSSERSFFQGMLKELEYRTGMVNLLNPFGKALYSNPEFLNADIVHYHLIHNNVISILDFPKLTKLKPSAWTIHDPWVITGNCIHPLECKGWTNGCLNCEKYSVPLFPTQVNTAAQMYRIKKTVFNEADLDIIVATKFMEDYIRNSPITSNFKRIHRIPFGINTENFSNLDKEKAKHNFNILKKSFVIGFRAEYSKVKGMQYIIDALEKLKQYVPVTILKIGYASLPIGLSEKYHVIDLGWQNDVNVLYNYYAACDVFLMPSLAESFGLMAIEAMASGCPIIVFQNTVLEEITFSPECGIAVPYKNSNMLRNAIEHLMNNPSECRHRGELGKKLARKHYSYEDYEKSHIELYESIINYKNGGEYE